MTEKKTLTLSDLIDAHGLAKRQLATDRARTKNFPELFRWKLQRMSSSPLAFLRGAAPLFYEMLAARNDLADGPAGEGWIVGDLHLENFGAYRPATARETAGAKGRPTVFDINDFDDTLVGPWRFDVLRLTTSLLLGGRELGANGLVALDLVDRLLQSWVLAAFDGGPAIDPPAPVSALIEQVRSRPRVALLDARTKLVHGRRRFVRGPRYAELPKDVLSALPSAFEDYISSVADVERPPRKSLGIVDAALRIAGTGSLGGLRIAVLVEGKGGPNGHWVFDLKEQGTPSAAPLVDVPSMDPATRVLTGFRTCLPQPPQVMGTTRLRKRWMVGRRLAPQEDRLNLRRLRDEDLPSLATYLGSLLGAAHARGVEQPPRRWSKSDLATLRAQAITLAGLHEAVYLALCDRMRGILPAGVDGEE